MKKLFKFFFIVFAASILFSCSQNVMSESSGISIKLPGAASRSVDVNEELTYVLTAKAGSSKEEKSAKAKSGDVITLFLDNGVYTVELKGYSSEDKKFENPFVYGEKTEVKVSAGETTEVVLKLKRSLYTVTFDADNATEDKKSEITETTVLYSDQVTAPKTDPVKNGYDFAGWYEGDEKFDFNTLVKRNISLKAKWVEAEAVFTITFDANEGTGTQESITDVLNASIELPDSTLTAPEGYEFAGWALTADEEDLYYLPGDKLELKEDMTLYAVWKNIPQDAGFEISSLDYSLGIKASEDLLKVILTLQTSDGKAVEITEDSDLEIVWMLNEATLEGENKASVTIDTTTNMFIREDNIVTAVVMCGSEMVTYTTTFKCRVIQVPVDEEERG